MGGIKMSEYRLDITGNINLSDYSNIHDYMNLVDPEDKFTINLEAVDAQHIELICSMLEDKGFSISTKGGHENGTYLISAQRRKH
jgi:hypothetical protein